MPRESRTGSATPSSLSFRSRLFVHVHHVAIVATLVWVFWLLFLKH